MYDAAGGVLQVGPDEPLELLEIAQVTYQQVLGDRVEVKHSDEYVAVNDERVADAEAAGCPDAPTS